MSGERYELGFGYYVVKNNPDTRVSNVTARREEEAYFSVEEPWSTVLSKHDDHFGTTKLVTALSQKLTEQIRTRYAFQFINLPDIKADEEGLVYLTSESR